MYREACRCITVGFSLLALSSCGLPNADASPMLSSQQRIDGSPPASLKAESRINPIGIGNPAPRLSWHANVEQQNAYEVEVATSIALLKSDDADLWDSGQVKDGRSVAIPYIGKPLAARQKAFWRVRVWSNGGVEPGPWSPVSSWQMGLLAPEDWSAKWITSPIFAAAESSPGIESWLEATAADPQFTNPATVADTLAKLRDVRPATYFRKRFTIDRPVKSALLYSTSAGYSEFFLSGDKIGDRVLNPAQTDFDKRIYYDVDDVTERLTEGDHTLGIHLGNGFYGERTAFGLAKLFYGEPAAIAQLEIRYDDGTVQTVSSDGTWRAHPSPILKNGVYSGEVFDARGQLVDWSGPSPDEQGDWRPAKVLEGSPTRQLVAAEMPPVRKVREIKPKAVFNPKAGVWTIDFGENFTGLPTVDVAQLGLDEGQAVLFRYAEWADENGVVGMKSGGGAPRTKQVDAYISDGADTQPWSPSFTWHGFRYMEVSGIDKAPPLGAFTGHLTRTDIDTIGTFVSSDPLLNRIHETAVRSFETNLVSVPSDCPIRERNGWTGDAHAIIQMASYNFAMGPFLDKYLGDFRTTDFVSPAIVPGRRTHSGKVDWAAAEVFLTWEQYLHNGDLTTIERQYESLLEYVAYVEEAMDDDLVTDPFHYYGDWCDALPELGMARPLGRCSSYSTPGDLTASALIARVFEQMAEMASLTGRADDAAKFLARRQAVEAAFNRKYYRNDAVGYGSQTANAMALQFGLAKPEKRTLIAGALDADVREKWKGHASVGALGQTWLYPALGEFGYADTAFGTFKAEGPPGYRYLFETLGGTTLWEDITQFVPAEGAVPGKSLNHPFKGGYDAWFFSGLGGIIPDPAKPGFKNFFLDPKFPTDLDEAKVSLETGYGTIRSEWKREGDAIIWLVEVPMNTTAYDVRDGALHFVGPGLHRFRIGPNGGREILMREGT